MYFLIYVENENDYLLKYNNQKSMIITKKNHYKFSC